VPRPSRQIVRIWQQDEAEDAHRPRSGLVVERPDGDGRFAQAEGPFDEYDRTVVADGDRFVDTTSYRLVVPWFRWLFAWPVRTALRSREVGDGNPPRWAPRDRLTPRQVHVLGLLAAASMAAAFVNTLFTQTVNFAAEDFGIGESRQGLAGVIVRFGIVIALPFTLLADRVGRRRIVVLLAWLAPTFAAIGALAPNFWVLTASQAIGRPLGIALDLLIAVIATEEMPRNSRAYAVSVLAMASGLGAGVAVMSLPLADLGPSGWRLVYVVALVWLLVAFDLARRLPETERFEVLQTSDRRRRTSVTARTAQRVRPIGLQFRRLAFIAAVAFTANLFVAPASYFQNRYLADVRGYSGAEIALFTIATATPASIGFVVGGRIADTVGRRLILSTALPAATGLLIVSFSVGGAWMWTSAFLGGLLGGVAYPAFAVYRTELFPTARRGQAGGMIAATALIGGSIGLIGVGILVDSGWSYGAAMGLFGIGQLLAAAIVLATYPETAHRSLEDLNPEDAQAMDVARGTTEPSAT
jgi:MFS family permease